MKARYNVQELIDLCRLAPENESAKALLKSLQDSQVGHKQATLRFDLVLYLNIDHKKAHMIDNKAVNINEKVISDVDAYDHIKQVVLNTVIVCDDDTVKEKVNSSLAALIKKIEQSKAELQDKECREVNMFFDDGLIEFDCTVIRTTSVLRNLSLGEFDFSTKE
ncbi:hypothetical protein [Serratia sp. Se-RSBMAAmG]|uniref:hypothetical protein n=1 Tax=Serratia sp. Se-RSBMAAmG TaxID=3043305 RepID=UPI0024AF14E3|nr:hypothetical protein [Serratia sp. Se-RSBMAAmG]MDI6977182.1 hypothetical protein [Serratia sp. Se-RSBMAAmG]